MKSYIKTFNYSSKASKGKVKTHKVFIMTSTSGYFQGFDLDVLTAKEIRYLKTNLKNHEIKAEFYTALNPSQSKGSFNSNPALMRAWRTYKKENIMGNILTKDELFKVFEYMGANPRSIKNNVNEVIKGGYGSRKRTTAYGYKIEQIDADQFKVLNSKNEPMNLMWINVL